MMNVVVRQVTETRVLDNRGSPVRAYRFTFNVGDHGPFTQDFSPNEVQDGSARTKLNEFAQQLERAIT